jgi:hypothetical protein
LGDHAATRARWFAAATPLSLMVFAMKFQNMINRGEVRDYSDRAGIGLRLPRADTSASSLFVGTRN